MKNIQAKFDADLTVRSFAYVARQFARSSAVPTTSAQYEQILGEAEKHRSALRLVQRDVFEMTEQELRKQSLTAAECRRLRESVAQTIEQAQQTITRITARYVPHKLAA